MSASNVHRHKKLTINQKLQSTIIVKYSSPMADIEEFHNSFPLVSVSCRSLYLKKKKAIIDSSLRVRFIQVITCLPLPLFPSKLPSNIIPCASSCLKMCENPDNTVINNEDIKTRLAKVTVTNIVLHVGFLFLKLSWSAVVWTACVNSTVKRWFE